MNFQVRIRTDAPLTELRYIDEWISSCSQGFAFEHDIPDNHHYHIYLFNLKHNPDWMRRHLGKHLPTKECYAVGTTCGKQRKPVEPKGAWIYGTTKRLLEPIWIKNFTDDETSKFRKDAEDFYGKSMAIVMTEKKPQRIPYQQAVIADAMADWENYKRKQRAEKLNVDLKILTGFVCSAMREHGRGINPHLVRDCVYGILFDDAEYRDRIIRKIDLNL